MPPIHYHSGKFPPKNIDLEYLLPKIETAISAIAGYEGALSGIPNSEVLLSPLTTQEAVLSSRIEGTHVTMEEVLEYEAGVKAKTDEKRSDIQEIINYRTAMRTAIASMEKFSLSLRVVKEAHKALMQGVRGKNRAPGEFRRTSVHIGPDDRVENAKFVPINAGDLPGAVSEWEKYLHQELPSKLIQLAVVHAEFEAIHPFLDGNGRVGRLLIPLFMVHKGIINSPSFYISAYLEENRDQYYEMLGRVSSHDDWTGWCAFFIQALSIQGLENRIRVLKIIALYGATKTWARSTLKSQYGETAVDWLFRDPIFSTSDFINKSGIPAPTARRLLREARAQGVLAYLREPSGRRPGVMIFPELVRTAEGSSSS